MGAIVTHKLEESWVSRPAGHTGFGQALFFKEGQGSEKCRLCCRQMPGGRGSQGRHEAGERQEWPQGLNKSSRNRGALEAGHGAVVNQTKVETSIMELPRTLESFLSSVLAPQANQSREGKAMSLPGPTARPGQDPFK